MDGSDGRHHVATGALIENGRVLLCLRTKERTWCPGVWDFPGGHVDLGESPEAALQRELREELGIDIATPQRMPDHHLVKDELDLKLWILHRWKGTPMNAAPEEHETIGWFAFSEVRALELAHESYFNLIERISRSQP
jgi:mutator protein MutT